MITKLNQEQVNAYALGAKKLEVISVQEMIVVVLGKDGDWYLVEGYADNVKFAQTVGLGRAA